MNPENFNSAIAHIQDGENLFQVLNEDGTDWDETATRAAYEAWLAGNP
jgi:ABC-type sugar transport system substrate-binding protein